MKGTSIEERAVSLARYIIDSKDTVRGTAKKFGISKSTVHGAGIDIGEAQDRGDALGDGAFAGGGWAVDGDGDGFVHELGPPTKTT